MFALALAVERHSLDEVSSIRYLQSGTYCGQVMQAIEVDIAMQVLHGFGHSGFEDDGGLVLHDDGRGKPKGKSIAAQK